MRHTGIMNSIPVPRECCLAMIAVCTAAVTNKPDALAQALDQLTRHVPDMLALADQLDPVRAGEATDLRRSSQVLAALNHAAYTFRLFTAADWRDMAEECRRQADKRTCIDCGRDVSISTVRSQPPSTREHRLHGDRWSCR